MMNVPSYTSVIGKVRDYEDLGVYRDLRAILEPASIQLQVCTFAQITADELCNFMTCQRKSVTAKIKIRVNAGFK